MIDSKNSDLAEHVALSFDAKGRLILGSQFQNQYLTQREVDILECLLLGCSAKESGLKLGISPRTIESYLQGIKLKLRCSKKSEIIALCMRLGILRL